jgi:nucleotide-binding universal stress UspA family protein
VRRQSGWTAPQSSLAERLASILLQWGPSVVVGISADHPSTSAIPRALREASAALDFAGVERRVILFPTLPVRSLLTHAGGEYVRATAPAWSLALFAADAREDGNLLKTLAALADAPSVPMMLRQRPAGSLPLRAEVTASNGYAPFE